MTPNQKHLLRIRYLLAKATKASADATRLANDILRGKIEDSEATTITNSKPRTSEEDKHA